MPDLNESHKSFSSPFSIVCTDKQDGIGPEKLKNLAITLNVEGNMRN